MRVLGVVKRCDGIFVTGHKCIKSASMRGKSSDESAILGYKLWWSDFREIMTLTYESL